MSKLSGWKVVCLAVAAVALSLLAANVVRADSFSNQAVKLDVMGVHLGMTPDQVKSVLDQHRKGMSWQEYNGGDFGIQEGSYLTGANARWSSEGNNGPESVIVVFSPPPGDPKLVAVLRDSGFDQSQAPTVEGLISSLTEKFGQPSRKSQDPSFQILDWAWDKAGRISKPSPSICEVDNANLDRMGVLSMNFIPDLQRKNEGGCAIAVEAVIYRNGLGIANRLEMTLIDPHDALQAAIATNNHVKQVKQAKAEAALKKAGANKPAL